MQKQRSQGRRDEVQRARQERVRREAERRARRLRSRRQLAAIVVMAVVLVGAMVAVDRGGNVQPTVADTQAVSAELAGVPRVDMTLGNPDAAVTINEYGDLQCTACSAFATGILPAVIDKLVKTGAAKLAFHNWTIIDQTDSVAGARPPTPPGARAAPGSSSNSSTQPGRGALRLCHRRVPRSPRQGGRRGRRTVRQ